MDTQIYSVMFIGENKIGDFNWMIKQPIYNNSLFIFNDNTMCFPKTSSCYCSSGGGNAIIRNYQCSGPKQLAAGIPTGSTTGFSSLTERVDNKYAENFIDEAILRIQSLIQKNKYDNIFYSGDSDGSLGTGIFNVDKSVISYITTKIHSLGKYMGDYHTSLSKNEDIQNKNNPPKKTKYSFWSILLFILLFAFGIAFFMAF